MTALMQERRVEVRFTFEEVMEPIEVFGRWATENLTGREGLRDLLSGVPGTIALLRRTASGEFGKDAQQAVEHLLDDYEYMRARLSTWR